MRSKLWLALIIILCVSLTGCSKQTPSNQAQDKQAVSAVVTDFGSKMQQVPLLSSANEVKKSIKDNYGSLVTPALLKKWQNDPQNAPGRSTSSPWPDHIEILAAQKKTDDTYQVNGKIIEMTSVEKAGGGSAAERPITLQVKKVSGNWLISDVKIGAYEEKDKIVYRNKQYGFDFTLPVSWKGYSVFNEKWEGLALEGSKSGELIESGPIIYLRHPEWTKKYPRQDIPIMIFTIGQWSALQSERFSVGAAPMAPSELGRNNEYVFALPARYNYSFPKGYQEVEQIIASQPLRPYNGDIIK